MSSSLQDRIARLVALVPFRFLRWPGVLLGVLVGSLWRVRRRHVEMSMKRAGIGRHRRIARAMYASLGTSLLEFLWMAGRPGEAVGPAVKLTARAERALAMGGGHVTRPRGVVLATAHTGNWDLAACAARDAGVPLTLVTKRLRVTSLDRFWQRVREARGVELVSGEGAFAKSLEALARGRAVALMIDQAPERTSAVTSVSFFGAPARCDVMPALLAARAGVPLVLLLGHRTGDGGHVLDAPLVLEPPRRPSRAWLEEATRNLTRALESFVAQHPEQWLWLHRRWKTHEPPPMRRFSKTGATGAPARQGGANALVTLPGGR